ncbi:hypothetical protein GCM10022254_06090 [Actinomadura meridiana]|uniref:Uncharacterized protein n=1 Tax=Actinomadura meridiana TaxID=559626 RepID=A0ABP8BU45_9ACTN
MTGRSHDKGTPFDEGRTSDYDIAVSGDSVVDAARARGIEFRSSGRNTPPLSDDQVAELGLTELRDRLSAQAGGRNINFMVYRNMDEALAAKPSIRNWF